MATQTKDNILLGIFILVFLEHMVIMYAVVEHGSNLSWMSVLGITASSIGIGSIIQKKYKSF